MTAPRQPRRHVRRGYRPAESEAAFGQKIDNLAGFNGWSLIYHTHNSQRSQPGFPDRVFVRAPRIVIAELKAEKAAPRVPVAERPAVALRPDWLQDLAVTHEQAHWLEQLRACQDAITAWAGYAQVHHGPDDRVALGFIEVHLWRPSDWPTIERVLARSPAAVS